MHEHDEDDEMFVFPWEEDGEFDALSEIEAAYGDNCVDSAISEVAELWARRSGTTVPCIGKCRPAGLDVRAEMWRWASSAPRARDEYGLYTPGFRLWLQAEIGRSAEFRDFVWDRFTEMTFEVATTLRDTIRLRCGDEVRMTPAFFESLRDRIGILPFHVRADVPPMPDDAEEELARMVAAAIAMGAAALAGRSPVRAGERVVLRIAPGQGKPDGQRSAMLNVRRVAAQDAGHADDPRAAAAPMPAQPQAEGADGRPGRQA